MNFFACFAHEPPTTISSLPLSDAVTFGSVWIDVVITLLLVPTDLYSLRLDRRFAKNAVPEFAPTYTYEVFPFIKMTVFPLFTRLIISVDESSDAPPASVVISTRLLSAAQLPSFTAKTLPLSDASTDGNEVPKVIHYSVPS